jgi:hypothetical protein
VLSRALEIVPIIPGLAMAPAHQERPNRLNYVLNPAFSVASLWVVKGNFRNRRRYREETGSNNGERG